MPKTFRQPCSIVVHVVSQTTVSGWTTAPKGSNVTLRSPSVVLCDSLARRSRPTPLSRSVDQRSGLAVSGEASHALKQAAESNRALRGMMLNLAVTAVRHFLYWPSRTLSWTRFHADLCWYPQRPTRTSGRCLL